MDGPTLRSTTVQLPENTTRRLEEFRKHVRVIKVAEGILAGLFGLAASYVAVFLLDRLIDTPAILRLALLLIGSFGLGVLFPLKWHKWVWGTRQMEQVAALLKHKFPRLGDQVLGVVELARNEIDDNRSVTLTQAAINQVDEIVKDRDFSDAVPDPKHRFWGVTAAVPLSLTLLALVLVPAAGANALSRWLMPWRDIDRYTFTQIEELPERLVVPQGEEFTLTAMLTEQSEWQPALARAWVEGRDVVSAERDADGYLLKFAAQTDPGVMHVRIGDVRESIHVQPEIRPEITTLQASINLPEYLQYSHNISSEIRGGVVSVVKGAELSLNGEVSRPLQALQVDGDKVTAKSENRNFTGSQFAVNRMAADESRDLELSWRDELGLTPKNPFKLKIKAVDDENPAVTCRQTEPQQVVLTTDVIEFELSATDDYGIQKMGLEWKGLPDPLHNTSPESGDKIVQLGSPEETSLSTTATFCAETDGVKPQSLQVRAFAIDYKPDAVRAYSPTYLLHVMTPEEHAIWLTDQLRRWASLSADVYEEEVRLHDENRAIRRLSKDDVAKAENQQRIRQQAAAERANASRLGAVTDHGDRLIKQAIRNPEMLVGHLETWAEILQKLREISDQKMPNVADLLDSASQPKPGKPVAANSSKKSKPSQSVGKNLGEQKPGGGKSPESKAKGSVPKISDVESGFNEKNEQKGSSKKKKGSGKFGLPTTTLQGGPKQEPQPEEEEQAEEDNPVDQAVEDQADLLAEFAKVREQLEEILADLENSTFVKRFKAASRRQMEIATDLNRTLFKGFGIDQDKLDERQTGQLKRVSETELGQSRNVWTIKSDLEAYLGRKQEEKYEKILDEMEELEVVYKLGELSKIIESNQTGESISRSEFWADTLDRWGEELVGACKGGKCKGCKGDSLPPAIVLEVMRILDGEIDLREATRGLENAQQALEEVVYTDRAEGQSKTQDDLHIRLKNVINDIKAIPEGESKFQKEINLLSAAGQAMTDATTILSRPDTGPEAIAAETEVIEILLQAKRCNPNGGGGGGGSTPGGGGGGDTDQSALATLGSTDDLNANVEKRDVDQAGGTTGRQLPEEFRAGLDAFFNALDKVN